MPNQSQSKITINLSDQTNPDDVVVKYISKNNSHKFTSLNNFVRFFIYRLKYGHNEGLSSDLDMNINLYGKIDIVNSGYPLQLLWPNQPWRSGHIKATIILEFVTDAPPPPDPEPSPLDDLR